MLYRERESRGKSITSSWLPGDNKLRKEEKKRWRSLSNTCCCLHSSCCCCCCPGAQIPWRPPPSTTSTTTTTDSSSSSSSRGVNYSPPPHQVEEEEGGSSSSSNPSTELEGPLVSSPMDSSCHSPKVRPINQTNFADFFKTSALKTRQNLFFFKKGASFHSLTSLSVTQTFF